MYNVFIKSLTFVLIIVIGYVLKKAKILKKEDANILATIIMNVTLPCALLTSGNGIQIDSVIVMLIVIGIVANVLMMVFGYFASYKESNLLKGAFMINAAGYNIGNFAMPFIQSFFPGMGIIYLCAFDIGNALMCLGITYAISDHVASGENHFDIKEMFRKLFSSIPFDVYVLIFILALFHLEIPAPILTIATTIGAGNSFLAMLMIGLMLEIKISSSEAQHVFKILGIRLIGASVISSLIFYVLPLPILAKKILVLAIFAPLSTISAVFTRKIGYTGDMSATANSISIIISVCIIICLLLLFI